MPTTTADLTLTAADPASGLRIYSKLLCLLVLGLIFKGALVTSHNAGLAVPDWPTSYGENMFLFPPSKWLGGIFYEHVHRLYASFVGFLTLILAGWIWLVDRRRWMRIAALLAVVMVVLQGILGGLTVLYRLPDWISTAHGMLAQTFLLLTIFIAYCESAEFQANGASFSSSRSSKTALAMVGLLYVQLLVGALVRHTESGLAVPDFPTMGGFWLPFFDQEFMNRINQARQDLSLPPADFYQVLLHLAHRFLGLVLLTVFGSFAYRIRSSNLFPLKIRFVASLILLTLCLQFLLGILTVLSTRQPFVTSAHVLCGAALLGLAFFIFLRLSVLRLKA